MVNKNNIERDLDEMTMAQIKVYVEELKMTIYRMAEVMEEVNSSHNSVAKELAVFSKITTSSKKKTSKPKTDKSNTELKETEVQEEIQEEEIDDEEILKDYSDDITDRSGPYILEFTYKINNKIDKAILSDVKNDAFVVKSIEPDQFLELESHTEYIPYFYFDSIPRVTELKNIWKKFLDNWANSDKYELISVEKIDNNKNRSSVM